MSRSNAWFFFITLAFPLICALPACAQQRTPPPPEFVRWLPVTDVESAMAAPTVDKNAGAEILFWRVHVVDELLGDNRELQRVLYHYIRLKVFDEKGKEQASSVDLPYREPGAILDVSGRTIKADGSIVELDRKTVYRRDLVRAGGLSRKVVSFAMPAVEKGAIVEYRWKQTEDDNRFRYIRLPFQREFPAQRVTYFMIPLSSEFVQHEQMAIIAFNCTASPLSRGNDGYTSTTVLNVPASRDEPMSPAEHKSAPWALLFYKEPGTRDPDKYWAEEGRKAFKEFRETVKSSDEIKSTAAAAIAGAKDDDEKIARLVMAVRKKVRSAYDSTVTTAEREKLFARLQKEQNRTSAEILRSGIAIPSEMNVVFAALAAEAGLDVRPALVADRDEPVFFPQRMTDRYFLDRSVLAAKRGDSWKTFDVSDRFLTPGMLAYDEEGVFALITDTKTPTFIHTAPAPPEASAETRMAHLALSTTGTLEGDVEESYTGHKGEGYRATLDRRSPAQREEWLRNRVVRMFPGAELSEIKIDGADDAARPFAIRYHLAAPLYAQVTAKRLIFEPSAFRRAEASPFSAAERISDIEFPYAWKETDEIHIKLPPGFSLDHADAPSNLSFGKAGGYKISIGFAGKDAELVTSREFEFGSNGNLDFPVAAYAALKQAFSEVRRRDEHTISLLAAAN
jgi:hypothetical protein